MKKYLLPTAVTTMVVLVGTLIISTFYYFNLISDKLNTIFLYLVSITAMFSGAFLLGKQTKEKGYLSGIIYYFAWLVIMIILSLVFIKASFSVSMLIYFIVLLISSILGSSIGINYKKEAD